MILINYYDLLIKETNCGSYKHVKQTCVWLIIAVFGLGLAKIVGEFVIFNPTASIPSGYYLLIPNIFGSDYEIGDNVLICLSNKEAIKTMQNLHVINLGTMCSNKSPALLKRIVALHNDVVVVSLFGILINNHLQPKSRALQSFKNIKFVNIPYGTNKLTDGEYWVLGHSSHSFDSRYFGVITNKNIVGKALLLWH